MKPIDWKMVLALAVLALPLTYCEMDAQKLRTSEKNSMH